jgi:prepilin-type processing-associated H-X9-DG protein
VRILPCLEHGALEEIFDESGRHTGWVGNTGNVFNRDLLRERFFPIMYCPSSTLPMYALDRDIHLHANCMAATYAGIGGAEDHPTTRDRARQSSWGRISWGGVLVMDEGVKVTDITDGTSNTIAVGEQSEWCLDENGNPIDCRSDCDHGFPMGPGSDGWERAFNTTCILHAINERSASALGVSGNCGPNTPILSAHPGGAHVLLSDGSVRFLEEDLEIHVLYNLANRDDGHAIEEL